MKGRNRTRRLIGRLMWLVAVLDLLAITASVLLAWDLRLNLDVWTSDLDPDRPLSASVGPWIVLVWMLALAAHGAYSPRLFGAGNDEFKTVYLGSVVTAGTVGMASFLLQLELSRGFVLLTFFLGIPMLILERYLARKALHRLRVRGRLLHRVVAVGGPSAVKELAVVMRRERHAGYEIVGACVPRGIPADEDEMTVPHLGSVGDTAASVRRGGSRHRCWWPAAATPRRPTCGGSPGTSRARTSTWSSYRPSPTWQVHGSTCDLSPASRCVHVEDPQVDEAAGYSKRVFDVLGALFGILLISPLLIVVAILVRLQDGGPVFFRQPRIGRDGAEFGMLKFRSMAPDADQRRHEIEHLNEADSVLFKIRDDPRVTKVGKYLRRYSLDELPQLFNVLKGDMSLVGPRPPLPSEVGGVRAGTCVAGCSSGPA